MHEIDICRNSSQKNLGVLRGVFKGLGVQRDTQMPCWLRPWLRLDRIHHMIFEGNPSLDPRPWAGRMIPASLDIVMDGPSSSVG